MSIFDNINPKRQEEIYKNFLNTGDVFLRKFEEAEHQKFFVIVGLSHDKIFICSVFINSKIHPSINNKPNIFKLHIPLLKNRNDFLKHDSYANCSYPLFLKSENITKEIINKECKVIGKINENDLELMQNALIKSGLLTQEEIELYF